MRSKEEKEKHISAHKSAARFNGKKAGDLKNICKKFMQVTEMADRIEESVKKRGKGGFPFVEAISFVELMRRIGKEAEGDYSIHSPKNCIWWTGVSKVFVEALEVCIWARKTLTPLSDPANLLVYPADAKTFGLPLAKRPPKNGYKKPHWLPLVFEFKLELRRRI